MNDTNTVAILRNERDVLTIPLGQVIFHAGDPGDAMYVVLQGTVNITNGDHVIEQVAEGGIFGEMALVDGAPRSASAIALTDVQVARVDQDRFMFLAKYNPYFTLDVLRVTVGRLRKRTE